VSIKTRMRRALGAGLAGAMVLALMPTGAATAEGHADVCEDVPEYPAFQDQASISATFQEYVECMQGYGIAAGFPDGTYRPGLPVTRQQMALFIARFLSQAENGDTTIPPTAPSTYTDRGAATPEARAAIDWLTEREVVQGFADNTYRPGANVTRAQMASYIARAMEAAGAELDEGDGGNYPDVDDDATHSDNINKLTEAGVVRGFTDGTYRPGANVTRQQMAQFIILAAAELHAQGLWEGEFVEPTDPTDPGAPIPPNQNLTAAPELIEVTRQGDIVTFRFDQNIPGKSLDFVPVDDNGASDEPSFYTGLRLYDVAGTAYFAQEAGIFGNEIRARFGSAAIVAAAARAGVYEDTVQTATGLSNPASDFALRPTTGPAETIGQYFPQLVFVGNRSQTLVTPPRITVDFVVDFGDAEFAEDAADDINDNLLLLNATGVATNFVLVGSSGDEYNGVEIVSAEHSGTTVRFRVAMDPRVEDVPVSQLQRGYIEADTAAPVGYPHALISEAYEGRTAINGTTADPDLRAVERGPGANQMRFIFDEAVNVPTEAQASQYFVTNNDEERATPSTLGRSLAAADEARVIVATFGAGDIPDGYDTVREYLETVTAAWVEDNAARATNQVGSQNLGWNRPAQVNVTPVQPPVPADPVPGATALPDLVSVTKTQNEITGNWRVVYVFDSAPTENVDGLRIDFALYDEDGVRFSANSRNIPWTAGSTTGGQRVFTFGPDAGGNMTFTNEQIEAAVLGTVQDADADLVDPTDPRPRITEGHDAV
jgi:hypothetical protein